MAFNPEKVIGQLGSLDEVTATILVGLVDLASQAQGSGVETPVLHAILRKPLPVLRHLIDSDGVAPTPVMSVMTAGDIGDLDDETPEFTPTPAVVATPRSEATSPTAEHAPAVPAPQTVTIDVVFSCQDGVVTSHAAYAAPIETARRTLADRVGDLVVESVATNESPDSPGIIATYRLVNPSPGQTSATVCASIGGFSGTLDFPVLGSVHARLVRPLAVDPVASGASTPHAPRTEQSLPTPDSFEVRFSTISGDIVSITAYAPAIETALEELADRLGAIVVAGAHRDEDSDGSSIIVTFEFADGGDSVSGTQLRRYLTGFTGVLEFPTIGLVRATAVDFDEDAARDSQEEYDDDEGYDEDGDYEEPRPINLVATFNPAIPGEEAKNLALTMLTATLAQNVGAYTVGEVVEGDEVTTVCLLALSPSDWWVTSLRDGTPVCASTLPTSRGPVTITVMVPPTDPQAFVASPFERANDIVRDRDENGEVIAPDQDDLPSVFRVRFSCTTALSNDPNVYAVPVETARTALASKIGELTVFSVTVDDTPNVTGVVASYRLTNPGQGVLDPRALRRTVVGFEGTMEFPRLGLVHAQLVDE